MQLVDIIFLSAAYAVCGWLCKKTHITCCIVGEKDEFGNMDALRTYVDTIQCIYVHKKNIWSKLQDIYMLACSKCILIDSSNWYLTHITLSRKTKVIYCGHGGGSYKKMGFLGSAFYSNQKKEAKRKARIYKNWDYVISTSFHINKYIAQNFSLPESNICSFGLPRCDALYAIQSDDLKKKYYNLYGIPKNKKLMLYAPTFRKIHTRKLEIFLDVNKLPDTIKEEYCIAIRVHPSLRNALQKHSLHQFIDISSIPLYEALAISDILISDYSSIIFEYAFFNRPIYLLVPDLQEYQTQERELWVTPNDLVGEGAVCASTEELAKKFVAGSPEHHIWRRFMDACDGNSTKRLVEFCYTLLSK